MSYAQKRVIVAFACLVVMLGWIDRRTSKTSYHQYSQTHGGNKTEQKSLETPAEDLIFGYPAIDVFTGILAIATLVLAWMAIRNVKDTRAIQRAHVFPLRPQHSFLTTQDGDIWGLRLWVPWKNSGTTPAPSVNSFIGITWVQNIQDFQFGAAGPQDRHQPFVLGPGGEIPSGTVDITHGPLNDLLIHRTGAQFLWGWARYQDIFSSTVHVVEFCFRVTVEGQLGPPPFTGIVGFAFYGPHNRYYDIQQDEDNSGNIGGEPTPMVERETNGRQHAENNAENQQKTGNPAGESRLFQGLLCLFTFFLVGVGALQWRTLEKTNQTLKTDQRAWLAPKPIDYQPEFFMHPNPPYSPAVIKFNFKNTGKEPARLITRAINYRFLDNAWDVPQINQRMNEILGNKTCDQILTDDNGSSIFPDDGQSMSFSLTEKDSQVVLQGGHYLMIGGCLVYRTISETHWTEVCQFLDPIDPNLVPGKIGFNSGVCPVHNQAD